MTPNLMVENVDTTVAFYQDILGFSMIDSMPSDKGEVKWALIQKDEVQLMLQEKENLIEEYPILSTAKLQPSLSLYMMVGDFDQLYEDIKSKHTILKDVNVTSYGLTEFAIADNNGYVLTFSKA